MPSDLASSGISGTGSRRYPIGVRAVFIVLSSLTLPFLLLLQAWKTRDWRYKHWLLTAFVTVYGATIAIYYDSAGEGSDGVRHLGLVYDHYVGLGLGQFLSDLWSTLTFQLASHPGIRDPYKHIVSYLTGGILGMPWLFFTIIAFVYGYFFTGSLLHIFRQFKWRHANYILLAFAALLLIVKNIEGVNTVRTWTGLWVLMYACLRYYDTRKARYIALMLMPPFIHFGYWIMVLPALAVLVFGNRPLLYAGLFVASSFTTFLEPQVVTQVLSETEAGASSVSGYYRESQIAAEEAFSGALQEGNRWYLATQKAGLQKWGLNMMIYTLLASGVYFSCMRYQQKTLFSIGLLTLTLSNSTWYLFALSNRSWIVGCVFILAAFIMARTDPRSSERILRKTPPYYKWGLHLSLLLFLPYFLYNASTLLDYPSIYLLGAPFVVWVNPELNMSFKYAFQQLLGIR